MTPNISLNARGHIEDVSLEFIDVNVNKWFGGADHDVSEEFVADRRHGLRVQRLRWVAFYLGTTSGMSRCLISQFACARLPTHVESMNRNQYNVATYHTRPVWIVQLGDNGISKQLSVWSLSLSSDGVGCG